jgi:hypothetical protein
MNDALDKAFESLSKLLAKGASEAQVALEISRANVAIGSMTVQICALLGDKSVRDLMRSELEALLSGPNAAGAGAIVIENAIATVDAAEE